MQRVRLPVIAFAVVVLAAFIGGSIAAVAQQAPPTTTAPPTSTTAPPETTTTMASPPPLPGPTTTTAAPPHATTTAAPSKAAPTTSTTVDPSAPHIIPPQYIPMINSVKRSAPNNSGGIQDALAPLRDFGLTDEQIAIVGFGRFPVGGYATFTDDWWMPRFTPTFHLHQGTDIFAVMGAPVRAPADGILKQGSEPVGGTAVYVTLPDGTYFYGAHLSAFVQGQKTGQHVKTGDVIGFVGDTGDAVGGAPHLHFEIHPKGGAAVDPKPYLDDWVKGAISNAPAVVASFESSRPRAVVSTALTREMSEGGGGMFAAPASPPRSQLLWATSASPSAGAVHFAEAEVAAAVREAGWATLSRDQAARIHEWDVADASARAVLTLFTPHQLWDVLHLGGPSGSS